MREIHQKAGQLISWLVEPASVIQESERRRQTKFLLSLLLVLIIVSTLSVTIDITTGQLAIQDFGDYMPIIGIVILVGIYGLSRTQYYVASATALVALLFGVIHLAPLLDPDSPGWLYYAMLPILLSGIFFSVSIVFLVAAASISSMLLLIMLVPEIEFDIYWLPIMYTVIITAVIVAFMRYRDLVEMDRQVELKQMASIIQGSADFMGMITPEGQGLYLNPAGLMMTGYTAQEFYEGKMSIVNFQPDLPPEALETALQEGLWTGMTTLVCKDSSTLQVSQVIAAIKDDKGNIQGFTTVTRDITTQREAELERDRLQQELIEAQKQAIQELSTPIIPVVDAPDGSGGIIVLPLIGSIDSMRARDITRALLAGISQHRAKVVIIDITGVPLVDSGVANHLNKTIQAAQLKGARTIVTGISNAVAEAIVDLGIDWGKIETLRDLQTGLMAALKRMGMKLGK